MKIIQWLTNLFTKESKPMTDTSAAPAADPAVVAPETVKTEVEQVKTDVELFEAKLKELVTTAGSQAHAVFDDLCKLAKQLI